MTKPGLRLRMVRCAACGHVDLPTASLCAHCLYRDLAPLDVPGEGRLVTWTTIRRAPTRFRDQTPYVVCVVDLDDGQRIMGRLSSPEGAVAGATVSAVAVEGDTHLFSRI